MSTKGGKKSGETTLREDTLRGLLELSKTRPEGLDPAVQESVWEYLHRVDANKIRQSLVQLDAIRSQQPAAKNKSALSKWGTVIGAAFEVLVKELFPKSDLLSYLKTLKSTVAEIDFMLEMGPLAYTNPMLRNAGNAVFGESKCKKAKPSPELVHETAGLMENHGATVAFIFVYCDPSALTVKTKQAIALHGAKGKYVVVLGKKQLDEIAGGENPMSVIYRQFTLTKAHANLEV